MVNHYSIILTFSLTIWGKWNEAVFAKLNENYKLADFEETEPNSDSPIKKDKKASSKEKKANKKLEEQRKKHQKETIKALKKKMSSDEPIWTNYILRLSSEEFRCKFANEWTKMTVQLTGNSSPSF
jgi:hypothetical protein